jgi:hypothetical protein
VQDVFFFQALHQAVDDQLIVFRGAQVLGNIFESEEKTWKILVAIKLIDFSLRDEVATALAKFKQRCRFDRTLKVKVQLCLRKLAEETARQSIEGHCL